MRLERIDTLVQYTTGTYAKDRSFLFAVICLVSLRTMTTELFKGIYITMRIYRTLIQTKSIPWNSSHDTLNALKWALYCSEVRTQIVTIAYASLQIRIFQGYEHVRQTTYYDEFLEHTQRTRQYISSADIPMDFLPNAYGYMLHVRRFMRCFHLSVVLSHSQALFCQVDHQVQHREIALRLFSSNTTVC